VPGSEPVPEHSHDSPLGATLRKKRCIALEDFGPQPAALIGEVPTLNEEFPSIGGAPTRENEAESLTQKTAGPTKKRDKEIRIEAKMPASSEGKGSPCGTQENGDGGGRNLRATPFNNQFNPTQRGRHALCY
jgi:hypothetical protein